MINEKTQSINLGMNSLVMPLHEAIDKLLVKFNNKAADLESEAYIFTENFPNHSFGWKILSAVQQKQGRINAAVESIKIATTITPSDAEAHLSLGNLYKEMQNLIDAEDSYLKCLCLDQGNLIAQVNLGAIYERQQKYDVAEIFVKKALQIEPQHPLANNNLAAILFNTGKYDLALQHAKIAINADSNLVEAHINLAIALRALGQLKEAEVALRSAIRIHPKNPLLYENLGLVYFDLKSFHQAIFCYTHSLAIDNTNYKVAVSIADAHRRLGQFDESLNYLNDALILNSNYEEIYVISTLVYKDRGDFKKSYEFAKKAIELNPNNIAALSNMGAAYFYIGEFHKAEAFYQEAIEKDSNCVLAKYNLGFLKLLLADYENGFKLKEYRFNLEDLNLGLKIKRGTRWLGNQDLENKTILLHAEQGLGDTIQFSRYASLLCDRGAKVLLAPQPVLIPLFATFDSRVKIVNLDNEISIFDYQCPLLSLPFAFDTKIETIPAAVPYLGYLPDRENKWRSIIDEHNFNIGVCWRANKLSGKSRSFDVEQFAKISSLPNVKLISLQKEAENNHFEDLSKPVSIKTLGSNFDLAGSAFLDTAAIMQCCDLVITCDTSIAHLAGAMGIKVWVILEFVPDWRWMLDRSDSPWYPTMRLFRQKKLGDWNSAFDKVEQELRKIL